MTVLVSLRDVSKSFGSQKLFEQVSFSLYEGDRMGLAGPNGAGKSTLLKILARIEPPDEGEVARKQGIKIAYASQSPEFLSEDTLLESVMKEGEESIPSKDEAQVKAVILLHRAGFDHQDLQKKASSLSGGEKKRLDIVRCYMKQPDLILLDEPTNHLDLEGIVWLEEFLQFLSREKTAFLIVSHDRCFLQNTCRKIAEINRCFPQGIFICEGSWENFVEKKEAFLEGQRERQRSLSGIVREEVEWLRRSPKARTTKSKFRVQKAYDLMGELQEVTSRNQAPKAWIDFTSSDRETKNLLVAKNLSKSLGGRELFRGIDIKLSPGSRLGVVGKNGSGKTTFLKILAGQIAPDLGTVKYAEGIKLVYFDQHRHALDPNLSLKEALSPQGDFVHFRGREIHVHGWAKKFLFPPERLNLPVKCLSGGERARIFIAHLMLEPADVLFLDEPTNDLDIPTLEVMEESLLGFTGAIVLITHDRYFMDRLCTQILGLGGKQEQTIFADFLQWQRAVKEESGKKEVADLTKAAIDRSRPRKKLSYQEQKELEGMEMAIMEAEKKLSLLEQEADKQGHSASLYQQMGEVQKMLDSLYDRWQHLLNKQM